MKKLSIQQLAEFIDKYDDILKNGKSQTSFSSSKEYKYKNLTVQSSYGQGTLVRIPWIALLGYNQKPQEGIYPVISYIPKNSSVSDKNDKLLVLYGVSKTTKPTKDWGVSCKSTSYIDSDNSLIEAEYDVPRNEQGKVDQNSDTLQKIFQSLDIVCKQFHKIFLPFYNTAKELAEKHPNIILQGAPGTGKTYNTPRIALESIGYNVSALEEGNVQETFKNELYCKGTNEEGRIFFTTFHQSMDYEDFIEGYKPEVDINGEMKYEIKPGIFKLAVDRAKKLKNDNTDKLTKDKVETNNNKVVLIIDEINRGNVSKIFGELISLIEKDKRQGTQNELSAILPYSNEKFSVPDNLIILGTMNTTDRSTGSLDYALRRRFRFVTMSAERDIAISKGQDGDTKAKIGSLFDKVKKFIEENNSSDMPIDDLMVGHSYFMVASEEELQESWIYEILPLLLEYYKDGIIKKSPLSDGDPYNKWSNPKAE